MAARAARLLPELAELERRAQAQAGEELSFRKLNSGFGQGETTQMLLDVCEKLALAKEAMQRANFEEHTSELPYLCRRFGTTMESGLSDRAYREVCAARHPPASKQHDRRRGSFLALCCQQEFPPRQGWWLDVSKHLNPSVQVLRAGKLASSSAEELVPGDVVYVHAGQRIPVDGRVLVFTEGSMVDLSQVTLDATDVRACSSEFTSETLTLSRNMVFKDSYVVGGSLFILAVRSVADPILPSCSRETGDQFTVDMNLPLGLSMSQCKSTFKALCVQARLACRSFRALMQLGRVGALVILLTQELVGTAEALCAAARRLQRALVLVACDCSRESLEALAGRAALELLDLDAAEPADPPASAASASRAGSGSPRSTGCLQSSQGLSQGEVTQLVQLTQRLGSQRAGGAILVRLSQAGLGVLCGQLADLGLPPLYAVGNFDFPDTFKTLVLGSGKSSASRIAASTTSPPKGSVALGTDTTEATPAQTPAGQDDTLRLDAKQMSRLHSVSSQGTASAGTATLSRDPAAMLSVPRGGAARSSIELLVSLNSIGVVSEYADCVLLKPDLLCLAQALDIAARAASSAPAPTARAEPKPT